MGAYTLGLGFAVVEMCLPMTWQMVVVREEHRVVISVGLRAFVTPCVLRDLGENEINVRQTAVTKAR